MPPAPMNVEDERGADRCAPAVRREGAVASHTVPFLTVDDATMVAGDDGRKMRE